MSINVQITILGISVVFLILLILYFLFIFMGRVFSNKGKQKKEYKAPEKFPESENEEFLSEEEYEVVAAIVSSIYQYNGNKDFFIKSVKRKSNIGSNWKRSEPLKYWRLGRKRNAKKI
jgi:sodium pump decarboxylase gamma subunit